MVISIKGGPGGVRRRLSWDLKKFCLALYISGMVVAFSPFWACTFKILLLIWILTAMGSMIHIINYLPSYFFKILSIIDTSLCFLSYFSPGKALLAGKGIPRQVSPFLVSRWISFCNATAFHFVVCVNNLVQKAFFISLLLFQKQQFHQQNHHHQASVS